MQPRHRLLTTLLLSGIVHAALLLDIPWREWWQLVPDDAVLDSREADEVERVQLALEDTTAVVGPPTLNYYRPAPPPPPPPPAVAQPRQPQTPPAARPPMVATDALEDAGLALGDEASEEVAYEAPPTFPVSVQAVHHARYQGIRLRLRQTWFMEGREYFIRNDARKFGFSGLITSEGQVSPDGLSPRAFRLLLNNNLQQFADLDHERGLMSHGRPGRVRQSVIPAHDMQDMASLPFHVAVSYEGRAERVLKVTTGSSIYRVVLRVVANERLRLPGGEIDTIHLQGVRQREDGSEQTGYDIWLAPSLRNYPVRFTGPDSRGNLLEMSVAQVDFDGRRVFGSDSLDDEFDEHAPDDLPPGLLDGLDFGLPAE